MWPDGHVVYGVDLKFSAEAADHSLKTLVTHPSREDLRPGMDLRRHDLSMARRSLDQVQIPGLAVEVGGEGVPSGVDGD